MYGWEEVVRLPMKRSTHSSYIYMGDGGKDLPLKEWFLCQSGRVRSIGSRKWAGQLVSEPRQMTLTRDGGSWYSFFSLSRSK